MKGSAIREMAAARTGLVLVAAFNERVTQIWNAATREKIGEFSAQFAFGSRTLAVHPDGGFVVTGASAKRGVIALYGLPGGELIWLREGVPYPTYLRVSPSGKYVYVTLDGKRIERIDSSNGATVEVLRNVTQCCEGPNHYSLMEQASGSNYVLRQRADMKIPKLTFGMLDVAFGMDGFCISESTGPVRCINYETGVQRWRYQPPGGSHVLRLHYSGQSDTFYGILWNYEKGLFRRLLRLDAKVGLPTVVSDLDSWEEVFIDSTEQLVTSSGQILHLRNGEIFGTLAFPMIEYPDPLTRYELGSRDCE